MVSQAELITLWFLVLSQFFRDGMGPFNIILVLLFESTYMLYLSFQLEEPYLPLCSKINRQMTSIVAVMFMVR